MDGVLTQRLHGNLHLLSEKSLNKLVKYYATGILSSKDQSSLLNEITKPLDTLTDVHSPD
jgi:hypothetical protein